MMNSGNFLTPRGNFLQDSRTGKWLEYQRKEVDLGRHTEMTGKFSAASSWGAIPSVRIVTVSMTAQPSGKGKRSSSSCGRAGKVYCALVLETLFSHCLPTVTEEKGGIFLCRLSGSSE